MQGLAVMLHHQYAVKTTAMLLTQPHWELKTSPTYGMLLLQQWGMTAPKQ
jgi:hypothetical protein